MELCTNDGHINDKLYKLLLKYGREEEQVKDCMIKWVKNFGYDIQMKHWKIMFLKGLTITRCSNLKEFFL